MTFNNYHIHTIFSDGKAEAESFIIKAIEMGMGEIGFSDHSPVPCESNWNMPEDRYDEYVERISVLRKKYADSIRVLIGIEVDYAEKITDYCRYKKLDYTIGSVHYFTDKAGKIWNFDSTSGEYNEILNTVFNGSAREMVYEYYRLVRQMIGVLKPDIIGHLDIIKKFNRGNVFFNEGEDWYKDMVRETLTVIKKSGGLVEINTRGLYKGHCDESYPSAWIINECKKLNIPMILSADAHRPEELSLKFPEAAQGVGHKNLIQTNLNR